jgi:uncharacterized protein (DUF427 family)
VPESVWDYPRPPRVEATSRRIRIEFRSEVIVDTTRAHRVLETSHPPVFYVALDDVAPGLLTPSGGQTTFCEWKGIASYFDVVSNGRRMERAAWTYHDPRPAFEEIRDAIAFYPGRMDACFVDHEQVVAQPGDFYGGWITSEIVGPFKGERGTSGW